jgi:DNA-binding LacI/PurR family transcriptional regulator
VNDRRAKRATLRDVAEAAGVSVWTASNTFSNPDRVAKATRDRVLAAADVLDYAGPNPGARTLALGRTGMISLVAPEDAAPLLQDPGAALVAQGLLMQCDRSGLSLVLVGAEDDPAVDGRIFLRATPPAELRGPVVVVDAAGGGVPEVRVDAEGAAAELARVLLGLGHRRIAVIAGPGDEDRLQAVVAVLAGIADVLVFQTSGTPWATDAHGETAARRALGANPKPTALMAMSDPLAVGALGGAFQTGHRVPQDVSVTGLGDLPGSADLGLTTAVIPFRSMGEMAGRILDDRIGGAPVEAVPVFPAPLAVRTTSARAPAA